MKAHVMRKMKVQCILPHAQQQYLAYKESGDLFFTSIQSILALPLLPLEEKKLKLHDPIVRSSEKLPKSQTPSFES